MLKCINCDSTRAIENEKLPILFSKKTILSEKGWLGEVIGNYGIEYYYCETCNKIKVYDCRLSEFAAINKYHEINKDIHSVYSSNPPGVKVTSIENPLDILKKILEDEYNLPKNYKLEKNSITDTNTFCRFDLFDLQNSTDQEMFDRGMEIYLNK